VTSTLEAADVPKLGEAADLVGIGGTVRNLAKMDLRRTDHPLPLLHGYELLDERLEGLADALASRSLKRRARLRGLNPDRADTIVGGAVVVLTVMRHLRTPRLVVSSRGLREGLALGETEEVPAPRHVRTISVATLAARFATWDARGGARRSSIAERLIGSLDPDARPAIAEMLEHAATLLDVGKAIDHYERFEHAAMIVTTADLAGFTHRALGILSAILLDAGGDASLGPFARLIPRDERPEVRRAAVALALAEEIHRRVPPGEPATITCSWDGGFVVEAPIPAAPQLRNVADRFRRVFGSKLAIRPAPANPKHSAMAPD
jgi:exopolyphosphatase/guanosine-5'-triphosphate,3'-diphosphate pyrophosphatase